MRQRIGDTSEALEHLASGIWFLRNLVSYHINKLRAGSNSNLCTLSSVSHDFTPVDIWNIHDDELLSRNFDVDHLEMFTIFPRSSTLSNVLLITLGTVFISGLAQIALPILGSPVPVTGQTLGVLLIGTSYGAAMRVSTFITYMLVSLVGALVFANGDHGMARLTGATGGYLIGMLIASLVIGLLAGQSWDQRLRAALPIMLFGDSIIFF